MATGMTSQVTGIDAALRDLRAMRAKFPAALGRALHAETQPIFDRSQEVVPVDKGPLEASGKLHDPVISGDTASVEMAYGNAGVDYAVIVHEDLATRHASGKQAKYAEAAVVEGAKGMDDRLAARAAREIGG